MTESFKPPLVLLILILVALFNPANSISQDESPQSLPDIINKMRNSIALVHVQSNIDDHMRAGTAFLITSDGIFATCRHNVIDSGKYKAKKYVLDTTRIQLMLHTSGMVFKATLVAEREDRDIALLKADINRSQLDSLRLVPLAFGKATDIQEGVEVGCTGYDLIQRTMRFGKTYYWLTSHRGIVSCVHAIGPSGDDEFLDSFQLDIQVNKGISGGPVYLTTDGSIIGMVKGF